MQNLIKLTKFRVISTMECAALVGNLSDFCYSLCMNCWQILNVNCGGIYIGGCQHSVLKNILKFTRDI
jgi:hypothetical protein